MPIFYFLLILTLTLWAAKVPQIINLAALSSAHWCCTQHAENSLHKHFLAEGGKYLTV